MSRTPIHIALTLVVVCAATPLHAIACEQWNAEQHESGDYIIGDIQINANDVFNTNVGAENLPIHRLANQLHIQSKPELIKAQLLFDIGDVFDQQQLDETARNLRSNAYLRSASITPVQVCNGAVDIKVETNDNWTLIPSMRFSRAGGENEYAFSVSELNLLGFGKSLNIELDYTNVRDQRVLQYVDPLLFGTRAQLTAQLQNNSDGEVQAFDVKLPFYALNSQRSWRVSAGNIEYLQKLYTNGVASDQLAVDREYISVEAGFSRGKINNTVRRWVIGWQYDKQQLAATQLFPDSTPVPERVFSYPYIEATLLKPKFIQKSNLNVMDSVEDVAIGRELRIRFGYAAKSFGSSSDAFVFDIEFSQGWQPSSKQLGLLSVELDGFYDQDGALNNTLTTNAKWFYFQSPKSNLFAQANIISGENLFENRQIVIGGETGLRGYPLRYQSGDNRARFTLEQRYFFDWYPLRLVKVGAAAFADIGSAWSDNTSPDWLRDVGMGLRLVSTRQANAPVTHIDFAVPLDATDDIDQYQLVVMVKSQF